MCLFGYQRAQTTTLVIDNFAVSQPALIIVSTNSFPIIVYNTEETASTDILGNERDLQLTMTGGSPNVISTASVTSGTFTTSIGKGGEGYALLQYDGVDGSMNLNTTGLTSVPGASLGLNLFSNGGTMFNLTYISNYNINGAIYVYDVDSGVSFLPLTFSATNNKISTIFGSFYDFEGFCDLSKVGAIEFFFDVADFNEFLLYQITIITTPPPPPPPPSTSCVLTLDDFTINQAAILVYRDKYSGNSPITSSSFAEDATLTHIIGGERDMQITDTSGDYYYATDVIVKNNVFSYFAAVGVSGNALLQYDGVDQSMNLNIRGFTSIPGASNGLDFTKSNGSAISFTIKTYVTDDWSVEIDIYVYDINGGVCEYIYEVDAYTYYATAQFPFQMFTGNCNFQQVGAIELNITGYGNQSLDIGKLCVID